jgi:MFS family permease
VLGRYPVVNGCNIAFIIWTMAGAFSHSTNLFITTRMLTGLAVASNVLNPAIIGDMFESEKRGSAMSLIMLAPLIGGAIGPAISGAIAQTLGWRQVLVIASSCAFLCEVLFLTCFRETYKMAILRRRIQRIQQESGEFENVTVTSTHENLFKLWRAITRPFVVLFGSAVLVLLALFAAVSFSYFYVMCISLPEVLQNAYNFTPAQAGSAFMSFSKLKHCITL